MGKLVEKMKELTKWTNPEKIAEYKKAGVGDDNYRWRLGIDPNTGERIKVWSNGWNCHVEFDCTGLLWKALQVLNVKGSRFTTETLPNQSFLRPLSPDEKPQDGDILIIEARRFNKKTGRWVSVGQHAAAIEYFDPVSGIGKFFGMQSSRPGEQPFGPDQGKDWGTWKGSRCCSSQLSQSRSPDYGAQLRSISAGTGAVKSMDIMTLRMNMVRMEKI